jgi:hypothetical protein
MSLPPWLNWIYATRALGVGVMVLGVAWHEGSLVIAGLGVVGAPTVFGAGKEK